MMIKTAKFYLTSLLALALTVPTYGHQSETSLKKRTKGNTPSLAADCAPASARERLNYNNVSTRIETGGIMWQDRDNGNADYIVPGEGESTAIYSGALWMGGQDVNGQLKIAAVTFRNGTNDFWTGPLSTTTAEIDPATCSAYDRFYEISRVDVQEFVAWWDAGVFDAENGTTTQAENFPEYIIPKTIIDWKGNGDLTLDQANRLAPFFDRDGDGLYDPQGSGDYPYYDLAGEVNCRATRADIPRLVFGDQTYWWVFNDKGNTHTETNGEPIGMEIRAQAFAFATNDEVNDMTFYNYEMINRSSFTLQNTYFGQWVDPDLGCSIDDYVGCNVERGLGYCYNGDEDDGNCRGAIGYGSNPPAIGIDFFEGPFQDSDGINNKRGIGPGEALNGVGYLDERLPAGQADSIIDNERFGMRRFVYYNIGAGPIGDPVTALDHYNYLRGIWRDGTRLKYGGNGNIASSVLDLDADFMFPGDSDPLNWGTRGIEPGFDWTEQSAGNPPGDRRFLQSAGPFTLTPGAVNDITVGVAYARATSGAAVESVVKLLEADDKAQALFDNCFRVLSGPDAPVVTSQEMDRELILYLSNPRTSNNFQEEYAESDPFIVTPQELLDQGIVYDNVYRFQGYQIFQVKDENVSVNDIGDLELVRPLFQCDIKDDIGDLVNFTFRDDLGANMPSKQVEAANEGIFHSFRVTEDLFAQGDNRLINYKKYYYLAIAYAYNNFKTYDPRDPLQLDGQETPYLSSRKSPTGSIGLITVIPHPPTAEAGGTVVNATYGQQPQITRIEGQGNGGLELDLSQETVDRIMSGAPWKADFAKYKEGFGPLDIKIVDPLSVPGGDFSLKFFVDSSSGTAETFWRIEALSGETEIKEVVSSKPIGSNVEQLILDWGISVTVNDVLQPGIDAEANQENSSYRAGLITARIEFEDSSRQWLTGVSDFDGNSPINWIRSGSINEEVPTDGSNPNADAYNDIFSRRPDPDAEPGQDPEIFWPRDPNQSYEALFDGGTWIAPYALTAYNIPNVVLHAPSPGGRGTLADAGGSLVKDSELFRLQSVDIVFTPDQDKWTRCPVLELQDDTNLSVGNAKRLEPRRSASVDKSGNPDGTGTGMGWFPGYAINVETGERLNMAFGEDSWLVNENGADMMWNPTSNFTDGFGQTNIRWGGKHYIYVFRSTNTENEEVFNNDRGTNDITTPMPNYDQGEVLRNLLEPVTGTTTSDLNRLRNNQDDVWLYSCIWVGIPLLANGEELLNNEATVKIRVEKPYRSYETDTISNGARPHYVFNLDGLKTETGNLSVAKEVLQKVQIVPNPYYAFSEYEETKLDNTVKLTNLPQEATISIYNLGGTLIRRYEKADPTTELNWDLRNQDNIPIASGVYIIHINAPGIGERIIKWLGVLRPVDLEDF